MALIQLRGTRTLASYIVATALRDRLFWALPVLIALAVALSVFIGGAAVVEKRELATAYLATATRLILVTGLVLFTCFHLRRAFDSREVELILSRPLSRTHFVFAYVISLVLLAAIAVVIATLVVVVLAEPEVAALAQWSLSLLLECTIMVLAALFFGLILPSAVASVLACLGFYVLARMIGLLTSIAQATGGGPFFMRPIAWLMEAISVVIPRLDWFGQTSWLVYGVGDETAVLSIGLPFVAGSISVPLWMAMLGQGLVYVPLLVAAALFDFYRRQF